MFFSVVSSIRNMSRMSVYATVLTACANRTSHGAMKTSNTRARGCWARAPLGLHEPRKERTVHGRALSISGAKSPGRAATEDTDLEDKARRFGLPSASLSSWRSFKKRSPYLEGLRYPEDEEVGDSQAVVRRRKRENSQYWYFLQCKKLIKQNKLQVALDLFSTDMLQEERLQPEEFNYSVLIGGCGRAGQLKKAFKLFNDMKKRGLEASDATYTALFNACAECPSKAAGLHHALKLEQELRRKNVKLNTITYHALLKAHAVTNHLQACLHTLREMLQNGHVVTPETFHYLLMGCVTNKDNGFRLALQIWCQMVKCGVLPDSKNYTLLLRAARDCGIGDPAVASAVLLKPVVDHWEDTKEETPMSHMLDVDLLEKQLLIHSEIQSISPSVTQEGALVQISDCHTELPPANIDQNQKCPNLLDVFEGRGAGMVSLCAVESSSDRLALIGGAQGFLQNMESRGLKPDVKTLTLLADIEEPTKLRLNMLLRAAKKHQLNLDVAFFNSLIRRAAKVGSMDTAQAVLSVMRQRHVNVDVQTFGSLALGCEQEKDALQLLSNMEESGLRPNGHVFSALISCATRRMDYIYLKKLLKLMKEKDVWPNEIIIRQLEFAAQYPPNYNQYKRRNNYLVHIDGFRGFYQQWLHSVPAKTAEQTKEQTETVALQTDDEKEDGLTEAQRKQRAAARRYHYRRGGAESNV